MDWAKTQPELRPEGVFGVSVEPPQNPHDPKEPFLSWSTKVQSPSKCRI